MKWQSIVDRCEMNAIEEIIAYRAKHRLAFRRPIKRYGLSVTTAGEGCERFGDLAISEFIDDRGVVFGLYEDA